MFLFGGNVKTAKLRFGFIIQKSHSSHGDPFQAFCLTKQMSKPRNCASGSLFKSPVAPTATRFKHFCAREAAGNFLGKHFLSSLVKNTTPVSKKRDPGILRTQSHSVAFSLRQPAVPHKLRPRTASRNHPSSRAGDQDDVSSQANSLKIMGSSNNTYIISQHKTMKTYTQICETHVCIFRIGQKNNMYALRKCNMQKPRPRRHTT